MSKSARLFCLSTVVVVKVVSQANEYNLLAGVEIDPGDLLVN